MNTGYHGKNLMVDWVKSLNKKDISYDAEGRLLIRVPTAEKIRYQDRIEDKSQRPTNQLYHPTDRIVQQAIPIWTRKLLNKYDLALSLSDRREQAAKLAEVFNNAALIFFSLGDVKRARELCYSQIHLFMNQYACFTFQPWINLSRIDRALGNDTDALKKLQTLEEIDYVALANEDSEIAEAVKTCSLLEPIKVFLQMSQHQKLLDFIREKREAFLMQHESFLYEAEVVALLHLNKRVDALERIHYAKLTVSPILIPVFLLRECEIYSDLDSLENVFRHAMTRLKSSKADINAVIFAHQLAEVMQKASQPNRAIKLIYESMTVVKALGDEVLQAECLTKLYQLVTDDSDKNYIERWMAELYGKTDYVMVRKKLMHACSALSSMKISGLCSEIDELYQKLNRYANSKI